MAEGDQLEGTKIALGVFKDWSNYLLVTTVAAAGWIGSAKPEIDEPWRSIALWFFGISIVFGVLTLALVPLIAQQIGAKSSIYDVRVTFQVLGFTCHAYLTQACRPQHVAFMAGILSYSLAAAHLSSIAIAAAALAVVISIYSKPAPDGSSRIRRLLHPFE